MRRDVQGRDVQVVSASDSESVVHRFEYLASATAGGYESVVRLQDAWEHYERINVYHTAECEFSHRLTTNLRSTWT